MGVKIIIDSTTDMRAGLEKEFIVVPLTVCFGDTEYIDGVTINKREFYEKLIECDTLPVTSQATPASFEGVFEEVVKNGDTAVVITLASTLSGTYQSAMIAASEYEDSIFVVDSESVTVGEGILAEMAVKLRNEGKTAKEIADILETEKKKVLIVALLDTLEYLKKGGRISPAVAFAGGLLSIKPVVCLEDGEIKVLGKARGSKQGNNFLVQEIEKASGIDFSKPLMLGYTGLSDVLLTKYVEDSAALWQDQTEKLDSAHIGSVIGTHIGPGAIAVAFFRNK